MNATCMCGKVFEASWYRLEATGPVCDDCRNTPPGFAYQSPESIRNAVADQFDASLNTVINKGDDE